MTRIMITPLYDTQYLFDNRIRNTHELEHKELLLPKTIALITELGEMLNEWNGFKFWKRKKKSDFVMLLEEYADGLAFILSLFVEQKEKLPGLLDHVYELPTYTGSEEDKDVIMRKVLSICESIVYLEENITINYTTLLQNYIELGYMFGFDWDMIVKAYYRKTRENHKRQDNDY